MSAREGPVRANDNGVDHRTVKIRSLNDQLRIHGRGGIVLVTQGIVALGRYGAKAVYEAVAAFDTFHPGNDPYGEHDCAWVEVNGERITFKIDYYDRERRFASPDPADPKITVRVMTICLAREY